jgi:alkaline phosphatase D
MQGIATTPVGIECVGQLDRLCEWLVKQQQAVGARPKFIVSGSVFVPNECSTVGSDKGKLNDDGWAGYPTTRKQLLKTIVDGKVENVVFLSGDIHCSNVARMTFHDAAGNPLQSNGKDLLAFSIMSSAFFWPYPFADGNPLQYVHDSHAENDDFEIDSNKTTMRYTSWNFQQDDNFTQVDVDLTANRINIRTFDKDGKSLDKAELKLS